MKKDVYNFINALMEAAPDVVEKYMNDDIRSYIELMSEAPVTTKTALTENGRLVLKYMQDNPASYYKAKDIADGLGISSRTVSGSMRKLVDDCYVEKMVGCSPIVYILTGKGKEINIEVNE